MVAELVGPSVELGETPGDDGLAGTVVDHRGFVRLGRGVHGEKIHFSP